MPLTRIALVGHCGFDSGSLTRFAQDVAPGAEVVRVNDQQSLDELIAPETLLLVNRVLDGRFDIGASGIEFIREITAKADSSPAMLISNYEDAQAEAVEAGALPGFGKSQVSDRATRQRVMQAIAEQ